MNFLGLDINFLDFKALFLDIIKIYSIDLIFAIE